MGRLPEPDALRRSRPSDQATWTHLPAAGRQGDPPPWPLTKPTARERARWAIEWAKPQALMWERDHQVDQVAQYVRAFVEAERPKAPVMLRALVDRRAVALGLTIDGLARNRWIIDSSPQAEQRPTGTEAVSAKRRFRVVDGGR